MAAADAAIQQDQRGAAAAAVRPKGGAPLPPMLQIGITFLLACSFWLFMQLLARKWHMT